MLARRHSRRRRITPPLLLLRRATALDRKCQGTANGFFCPIMVVLMSFLEGFRQGREAARAARAGSSARPSLDGPSPIKLGYFCGLDSDKPGEANLFFGERHIALFGLNGAGKSTRFLIELLMILTGRSIFVF